MRWIVIVVGVVVLIGAAVMLMSAGGAKGGAGGATLGSDTEDKRPRDAEAEALSRLREEISRAEQVERRTDAQRLADARSWIAANRAPDWPYTDLEASMLALYAGLADGEKRSAAWALDAAVLGVEMTKAIDSDADGLVSDDEVSAYADFLLLHFDPESHPYLLANLDPDGDGKTGLPRLANLFVYPDVLDGISARVQADLWDADGDGMLSEGERAAGRKELLLQARIFEDGHIEYIESPGENAAKQQAAILARMAEMFGEGAVESVRARQESAAPHYLTAPLIRSIRLEERGPVIQLDPSLNPAAPDMAAFDDDGDGQLNGAQMALYMEAWEEYGKELDRANALLEAHRKRAQFEAAAAESDADGDGRMAPGEWDRRLGALLAERDARLFQRHYDLDGSGRVDAHEVDTFLSWYRVGSLRADANFDGDVNALDLEEMAANYEGEGG